MPICEEQSFNPTKEEFEYAMKCCFTVTELVWYFGVERKTLSRYVYNNYNHFTLDSIFRVYKAKTRKLLNIETSKFEKLCALGYSLENIARAFGSTSIEVEEWVEKTYQRKFSVVHDALLMHTRCQVRETQLMQMKNRDVTSQNVTATNWFAKQIDEQRDNTKVVEVKTPESVPYEEPDVFEEVRKLLESEKQ